MPKNPGFPIEWIPAFAGMTPIAAQSLFVRRFGLDFSQRNEKMGTSRGKRRLSQRVHFGAGAIFQVARTRVP